MKLAAKIAGWVMLGLVGAAMLAAGGMKLVNPADFVKQLGEKSPALAQNITLIGVGEVLSALLLLIPRTQSLGVLLVSAFWGGAILFHMAAGEAYWMQAGFLLMTWLGATLRNPRTMTSFYEK